MQLVSKFNIWITILMKLALYKYLTSEIVGEKGLQDEKRAQSQGYFEDDFNRLDNSLKTWMQ